jgi:hypothetical protein
VSRQWSDAGRQKPETKVKGESRKVTLKVEGWRRKPKAKKLETEVKGGNPKGKNPRRKLKVETRK